MSTVRGTGESISRFVDHHLAVGLSRVFLFFDDPDDEAIQFVPDDSRVSVIRCDESLRDCWADWPEMLQHVGTDVMARQVLNVEVCLQLARSEGIEWLLHLDGDELMDCEVSLLDTLRDAAIAGIEQVRFRNLEGVPEALDITDGFREVTLFKRNPLSIPELSEGQRELLSCTPQIPADRLFLYYKNGKAAVQVQPGIKPTGCHAFAHHRRSLRTRWCEMPRVLHYANPGFEAFWRRYQLWGGFGDRWFGETSIRESIGDFHLDARAVVARGDQAAAREFYRERAVLENADHVAKLISSGICERIKAPRVGGRA